MLSLSDFPAGSLHLGVISHASVASNGAGATLGGAGAALKLRAPCDARIVGAFWEAHGADQSPIHTASYRRLSLIGGGGGGAGTTVLASLDLSASLASNTVRSLSLASFATVAQNDVIVFSHATIGGNHSDGTVLQAGQVHVYYRPI